MTVARGDRPRRWRVCVVLGLGAVYLPALVPLCGIGPLTECPHCVETYLQWLPLAPVLPTVAAFHTAGWVAGLVWVMVVGALGVVALHALRWRGVGFIVLTLGLVAIASGGMALGFASLLRM